MAINLTLGEAAKAQRVDEKFIIHSRQHKTSSTYRPAVLVLDDEDAEYFKYYIDVVRSTIKGGQHTSELAHLQWETTVPLSRPQKSSKEGMEVISGHMCHSTSTSECYYHNRTKDKTAVAAFKTIRIISGKSEIQIRQPP